MMIRKLQTLLFLFLFIGHGCALLGQNVTDIKSQPQKYIWGEGKGTTLQRADNDALTSLISQISTTVESEYEANFSQINVGGGEVKYAEKINDIVRTYSNATLHNTERLVLNNEPDAHVFRYIKREDVRKVFESRAQKIRDFANNAVEAKEDACIADALRNNYWALCLLKSHPKCNELDFMKEDGTTVKLMSYLPEEIRSMLADLSFHVKDIQDFENERRIILDINYKGRDISNLEYSYWDGQDWGNIISARNGEGFVAFYGDDAKTKEILRIKVEYIFENQSRVDDELEKVMEQIEHQVFRKSYFDVRLPKDGDEGIAANESGFESTAEMMENPVVHKFEGITIVEDDKNLEDEMLQVLQSIDKRDFQSVRNLFTDEGFEMYQKLMDYGNASIINLDESKFLSYGDALMYRPVRMSFNFPNNNRQFVEDVSFHFNKDKKIESLAFTLSKPAVESLLSNNAWPAHNRIVLINFLEHFKTAYALKRLDYIESIFADDALIITGHVVKTRQGVENKYKNHKIVRYNRQTKAQYIRNLKYSFDSKEFINIQFEESEVRKGGTGGNVYGVKIKQNYFSSNYGDTGYLFLMVDLNDSTMPVIHVRTWQPDKTNDTSIYRLSDF